MIVHDRYSNFLRYNKKSHTGACCRGQPGDYRLLKDMLREARYGRFDIYNVDRLSSAVLALEDGSFDAVLLDLDLPDSKGLDTFSKLHGAFPEGPAHRPDRRRE